MTEAAAPTERVRPAQALPITPARAAVLQEACAVATAIHSALDLGAVVRVTEAPAEPAAVAADCGLTQQGARLVQRVAEALRPGGRGAIVDILPNERGDGPRPAVLYALGLVLRTGSGRIYPYSTFRHRLGEGGFEDTRRHNLPGPYPFTLIAGRRR